MAAISKKCFLRYLRRKFLPNFHIATKNTLNIHRKYSMEIQPLPLKKKNYCSHSISLIVFCLFLFLFFESSFGTALTSTTTMSMTARRSSFFWLEESVDWRLLERLQGKKRGQTQLATSCVCNVERGKMMKNFGEVFMHFFLFCVLFRDL